MEVIVFLLNVGSFKNYMALYPRSGNRLLGTCCTLVPCSADFCPEDGGDIFLRIVGSFKNYTAPYPRSGNRLPDTAARWFLAQLIFTLKTEAIFSSEMSDLLKTTLHHIPEMATDC
jgi:hypothetical protein